MYINNDMFSGTFRRNWEGDYHCGRNEALANCLVNADFYIGRGIGVRKNQKSIVIENPGYVRTGKRQMLKGGISDLKLALVKKSAIKNAYLKKQMDN